MRSDTGILVDADHIHMYCKTGRRFEQVRKCVGPVIPSFCLTAIQHIPTSWSSHLLCFQLFFGALQCGKGGAPHLSAWTTHFQHPTCRTKETLAGET